MTSAGGEAGMRRRALVAVSDRTGLAEFATALVQLGFELVSTGGRTARAIREAVGRKDRDDH